MISKLEQVKFHLRRPYDMNEANKWLSGHVFIHSVYLLSFTKWIDSLQSANNYFCVLKLYNIRHQTLIAASKQLNYYNSLSYQPHGHIHMISDLILHYTFCSCIFLHLITVVMGGDLFCMSCRECGYYLKSDIYVAVIDKLTCYHSTFRC